MSVLVRGMEMPYICDCCDFCDTDYNNYSKCCRRLFKDIPWEFGQNGTLPDCPLVEVETPHGRLGDLDELAKYKYENIWTNRLIIDADDLEDAPTVIESEE